MKTSIYLFAIGFICAMFAGCKHESTVPLSNLANDSTRYKGVACSKDSVYFFNDVGPLIISSCAMSGCHDGNSGEAGPLTTYSNIRRYVTVGSPNSSRLYTVLSSNGENLMPRPPQAPFTAAQKALIYKWIQQGALNNGCVDANCDTTNVTYSGVVQLIMQTNCTGCHSASIASGGVQLDTYASVKAAVNSGRLVGSISQSAGFKPMPPGTKLSDCNIKKIKVWINKGSLNN